MRDEIQLLVDFRREMPTADADTRRRVYTHAVGERRAVRPVLLGWLRHPSVGHHRRLVLLGTAIAAAAFAAGAAFAASGWLTGSPAPRSVQSDFGGYTPQLGFDPAAGDAVQVASDGDSQLYATTNTQGSYCVVVSSPSSRPDEAPDGGSCIDQATAGQPIVAGLFQGGAATLLLAGRISVGGATDVTVQLPGGKTRKISLGSSGFFLASIDGKPCQFGNWSPSFTALNADGTAIASSTITLEGTVRGNSLVTGCWMPGTFTAERAPAVAIQR